MSRFDFDDDYDQALANLWEAATHRATYSPRGQRFLRELRDALLAMPVKRLICGEIIQNGEVCAIGAYAAAKLRAGKTLTLHHSGANVVNVSTLEQFEAQCGEGFADGWNTMWLGEQLGIAKTLAQDIAYANDERVRESATPEERWASVLGYVETLIVDDNAKGEAVHDSNL